MPSLLITYCYVNRPGNCPKLYYAFTITMPPVIRRAKIGEEQMISRYKTLSLLFGAFAVIFTLSIHTAKADRASTSTAPLVTLPDFAPVAGAISKIVRNDNGVTVSVSTTVNPGTYTMWMLLWNDPDSCTGGGGLNCNPTISDPPDCVLFTAGHVVGNNGTLNYTGHRKIFDISGFIGGAACADGLTNPQGADIHLIIRSHGPKLPGQVNLQISTVGGGCDVNECDDVQAAAHEL